MITVKKDDKTLKVTKRAFEIVYKSRGFKAVLFNQEGKTVKGDEEVPVTEKEVKEKVTDEEIPFTDETVLEEPKKNIEIDKDNITVKEIEELLEEYDIKYPSSAKRDIKLDLLITGLELEGLM